MKYTKNAVSKVSEKIQKVWEAQGYNDHVERRTFGKLALRTEGPKKDELYDVAKKALADLLALRDELVLSKSDVMPEQVITDHIADSKGTLAMMLDLFASFPCVSGMVKERVIGEGDNQLPIVELTTDGRVTGSSKDILDV